MRRMVLLRLGGLVAGTFLYAAVNDHNWVDAVERSYYMIAGVVIATWRLQ